MARKMYPQKKAPLIKKIKKKKKEKIFLILYKRQTGIEK
jgi:hypothetical protein